MLNRHIYCGGDQTSLTIDRLVSVVMEDAVSPKDVKPFVFDYVDRMTTMTSPSKTNCLTRLPASCLSKITTDPFSHVRMGTHIKPVGIGVIDSEIGSCENRSINQEAVCSLSYAEQRRAAGSMLVGLRQNPILVNANANGTLVPTLSLLRFRIASAEKAKEDRSDVLPDGVHNLPLEDPHRKPSPENYVFNVKTEPVVMEGGEFEKQTDVETSAVPESTILSDYNLPLGDPQQRPSLENSVFNLKMEPVEMEDGVCDEERMMTTKNLEGVQTSPESTLLSDHISPSEDPRLESSSPETFMFKVETESFVMEDSASVREWTVAEDMVEMQSVPESTTLSDHNYSLEDQQQRPSMENSLFYMKMEPVEMEDGVCDEEWTMTKDLVETQIIPEGTILPDHISPWEHPQQRSPQENSVFYVKTEPVSMEDGVRDQELTMSEDLVQIPAVPDVVAADTLSCSRTPDDDGDVRLYRLLANARWGYSLSDGDNAATSRHTQGTETMVVDDGSDCEVSYDDDWVAADASDSDGDASCPHAGEALRGKPVLETEPRDVSASGAELQETADGSVQRTRDARECHKCGVCEACFPTAPRLSSHYRRMHLGVHLCDVCGKLFASANSLKTHRRTHMDDRPHQCGACDQAFKTQQSLHQHRKVHSNRKTYECNLRTVLEHEDENTKCSSDDDAASPDCRASDVPGCKQALKLYKKLECNVCGGLFRKDYLVEHVRIHTGEKPHACGHCTKTFVTAGALKRHVEMCHSDGRGSFRCDLCSGTYMSRFGLKQHLLTHADAKRFQCEVCGRWYKTRRGLKQHRQVHHEDVLPSYSCKECGKTFTCLRKLKGHLMWHKGTLPYVCSYCGWRLMTRETLWAHELIHENWKPYKCGVCQKGFRKKHDLKRHMSVHTGVKPFSCALCGKQFIHRVYLARHKCVTTEVGDADLPSPVLP